MLLRVWNRRGEVLREIIRRYRVIETEKMSAEELQEELNNKDVGILNGRIEHVVGSKVIIGYDTYLTGME